MILKEVETQDHKWLVELHNDPLVLNNLTNPNPITMETHMSWWNNRGSNQRHMIFTVDNLRAGFVKIRFDDDNHVGILGADLHKDFRGKGLAKHMWVLLTEYCFTELQLNRLTLTTAEYNKPAIKTYDKLFKFECKLKESLYRNGKYFDELQYYILKKDWKDRE